MPTVQRDSVSIYYETHGAGAPLVLIPGMLSDSASWAPIVPALSTHFQVILIDTRGAGRTTPYDAPLKLAFVAEDVLAVLDTLSINRAHVAGHSMGGLIAMACADRAPNRIASVMALATAPSPAARIPTIFHQLCALRASHPDPSLWLRSLFTWLFADAFFWDRDGVEAAVTAGLAYPHLQSLEAMQQQTRSLARLDISSVPSELAQPSLALLADEDALIPLSSAQEGFAKLGMPTQVIAKAGHSLHWDQPEATVQAMLTFLDAQEQAA